MRIFFRCFIGLCQFLQCRNQGFGNVQAAVFAEKAVLVGSVIIFMGFFLVRFMVSDGLIQYKAV